MEKYWKVISKHCLIKYKQTQTVSKNQTINQLEKLELTIKDNQNPLDFPITDKELTEKIKNLQLKKASGPDGILNEMIKHTSSKLQLAVLQLFNVILSVGYFPDIWNAMLSVPKERVQYGRVSVHSVR